MADTDVKSVSVALVQSLVEDDILAPQDLARFSPATTNPFDPEHVRVETETWYRTLGIEFVTRRPFSLEKPPFTEAELIEADRDGELVLCVPKEVTRQQLGRLFHLSSWALADDLVTAALETSDFWFKTKLSDTPTHLNKRGADVSELLDRERKLGMSLSRYMVFVARMRHLTGRTPDQNCWVWLTRSRYDQKGMLVAGFDSQGKFSVHGWLPNFQGPRCGLRYVAHPDHL